MGRAWEEYNAQLLHIGDSTADPEVIIAKKCGHFIQHDDPSFVAGVLAKMLEALEW